MGLFQIAITVFGTDIKDTDRCTCTHTDKSMCTHCGQKLSQVETSVLLVYKLAIFICINMP